MEIFWIILDNSSFDKNLNGDFQEFHERENTNVLQYQERYKLLTAVIPLVLSIDVPIQEINLVLVVFILVMMMIFTGNQILLLMNKWRMLILTVLKVPWISV